MTLRASRWEPFGIGLAGSHRRSAFLRQESVAGTSEAEAFTELPLPLVFSLSLPTMTNRVRAWVAARTDGAAAPAPDARTSGGDWAVLFDAEYVPATKAGAVLASVARHGAIRVRLAFGDFSRPHLAGWKNAMLAHGIRPVHALTISPGKNTADLALVAGAVKLAYTTDIAGFAIASSDSDFTDLALQLREAGRIVHGYGARTTLAPFVAACDRFLFTDNLGPGATKSEPARTRKEAKAKSITQPAAKNAHKADDGADGLPEPIAARLRSMVEAAAGTDGWANLAAVCQRLHGELATLDIPETAKRQPGRYLKSCGLFEVANRSPGNGKPKVTYLRTKGRAKPQRGSG